MTRAEYPAVVVDGLSKTFRLPHERVHTLKERALHPFRRTEHDELRALRDVSFAVERGEFFGIVGRNGSGKSTLLKCTAGIYKADGGTIYVNGRMSTFIELGVGFNPDLAAYDNAMINATMLGLSTKEARRRFDQIIDFAELREFVELKIKNYSSGMLVRLAFSVMIQVDADILLIDEVLAVGDAAFQQKCFDEFARIRRQGTTVLLVTHDMGAVERFCDRGILLERGRVVAIGDTEQMTSRYLELNFSEEARAAAAHLSGDGSPAAADGLRAAADADPEGASRLGDRRAEVLECWFENEHGQRTDTVPIDCRCTCAMRVRFHERCVDPVLTLSLINSQGDALMGASNRHGPPLGVFEPASEVVFRAAFTNVLAPDRYSVTAGVAPDVNGLVWHDRRHRLASVVVTGTGAEGLVHLPYELSIERVTSAASELAT
ncbi:MAG: ABC transporter ATP-binding protein [Actinomycetota bacterium]|nr:ABC transporter ATP-binding protein [Actinomycetota bacterium]